MEQPPRQRWVRTVVLVGVAYFLVGRLFAWPTSHVQAWRLAAWAASGATYAAHIWHEHCKLRNPPRTTAWHTATAVAIGGFALAVAGALHSLAATSTVHSQWLLAFVLWPIVTGVPAFVVALVAAAMLARLTPQR